MKYKIINHDEKTETIELIADEILNDIKSSNTSTIICPWYEIFKDFYISLFNLNNTSKEFKKKLPRNIRKKIINEYKNIKIINMYDFIGSDNLELSELSTFNKFKKNIDSNIELSSFGTNDDEKINKELLINPSDFDRTIKTFSNGRIGLSIVYVDKDGEIPYIENYVENIGTNLTSLDDNKIEEIKIQNRIKNIPEQTINCGNRCLTKSHKIITIIENEAIKYLINDELENVSSASIKTLRKHDNVIYIVKSW